jgi:hypothetical protein
VSRLYPLDRFSNGDVAAPHEVNEDWRQTFGEFNTLLDQDNIPSGLLPLTKFAPQTFHGVMDLDELTVVTQTIAVEATSLVWTPVPGNVATATFDGTINTTDSALVVKASARWSQVVSIDEDARLCLGIFVDGRLAARSGGLHEFAVEGTAFVNARVPVSAGPHLVALRWLAILHPDNPGITWHERNIFAREARR